MSEQRGEREAAGAGGEHVDLVGTGDLARDGDGLLCGREVGVHVPGTLRSGGIAPGDCEELHALLDGVFGEAAAGREVDHVELVDLRRQQDQRARMHLFLHRPVLDQLEDLAAIDDGARRHGEVLADLELALVDLARHAAVVEQVVDQVLRAVQQAAAAGLHDALERAGVAEQ